MLGGNGSGGGGLPGGPGSGSGLSRRELMAQAAEERLKKQNDVGKPSSTDDGDA